MTQIGLLIPRSSMYSSINFDFLDGLKCSLANCGIKDAEIKTAGIGVGGSDKDIYTACEKMLFEGVEFIAGYVNPNTAEMIQPLFVNSGAIFIALDAGYQIARPEYKQQHIFTLSLDGTLGCKLMPKIAAELGDKDFAYTSSFYDSGYRSAFGFFQGVNDIGSNIAFNHITKLLKADFTLEPLTAFLKENPSTAVMAAACGDMTLDLFGAMEAEEEYTRHHIYAAPFVAEEVWLAKAPYPGTDVNTVVAWATGLDKPENKAFIAGMSSKKRVANVFSLLSWEAGILVAKALEADDTADRIALLENFSFTGPRGKITIDKDTHNSHGPLYAATITENEANGMCILTPGAEVDAASITQERKELDHEIAHLVGSVTSWFNVYGCLD